MARLILGFSSKRGANASVGKQRTEEHSNGINKCKAPDLEGFCPNAVPNWFMLDLKNLEEGGVPPS